MNFEDNVKMSYVCSDEAWGSKSVNHVRTLLLATLKQHSSIPNNMDDCLLA